jgi:hypothetical protein
VAIIFEFEEWRLSLPADWVRMNERVLCKAGPELGQLQISRALATSGPTPSFDSAELERVALGIAAKTRFTPTATPEHYRSGEINVVHLDAGANEQFSAHIWVAGVPGLLLFATYMTPTDAHAGVAVEIADIENAFRSIAVVKVI